MLVGFLHPGVLLLIVRVFARGPSPRAALLHFQEIAHMVELTDAARQQLDGYFADKEKASIRIYLSSGG